MRALRGGDLDKLIIFLEFDSHKGGTQVCNQFYAKIENVSNSFVRRSLNPLDKKASLKSPTKTKWPSSPDECTRTCLT